MDKVTTPQDHISTVHWHTTGRATQRLEPCPVSVGQDIPIPRPTLAGDYLLMVEMAFRPAHEASIVGVLIEKCHDALDTMEPLLPTALVVVVDQPPANWLQGGTMQA